MPRYLSTREVAEGFAVQTFNLTQLFRQGLLNEGDFRRVAGRRVVAAEQIPIIAGALAKKGWLTQPFTHKSEPHSATA